jgi:hypothetical protein
LIQVEIDADRLKVLDRAKQIDANRGSLLWKTAPVPAGVSI